MLQSSPDGGGEQRDAFLAPRGFDFKFKQEDFSINQAGARKYPHLSAVSAPEFEFKAPNYLDTNTLANLILLINCETGLERQQQMGRFSRLSSQQMIKLLWLSDFFVVTDIQKELLLHLAIPSLKIGNVFQFTNEALKKAQSGSAIGRSSSHPVSEWLLLLQRGVALIKLKGIKALGDKDIRNKLFERVGMLPVLNVLSYCLHMNLAAEHPESLVDTDIISAWSNVSALAANRSFLASRAKEIFDYTFKDTTLVSFSFLQSKLQLSGKMSTRPFEMWKHLWTLELTKIGGSHYQHRVEIRLKYFKPALKGSLSLEDLSQILQLEKTGKVVLMESEAPVEEEEETFSQKFRKLMPITKPGTAFQDSKKLQQPETLNGSESPETALIDRLMLPETMVFEFEIQSGAASIGCVATATHRPLHSIHTSSEGGVFLGEWDLVPGTNSKFVSTEARQKVSIEVRFRLSPILSRIRHGMNTRFLEEIGGQVTSSSPGTAVGASQYLDYLEAAGMHFLNFAFAHQLRGHRDTQVDLLTSCYQAQLKDNSVTDPNSCLACQKHNLSAGWDSLKTAVERIEWTKVSPPSLWRFKSAVLPKLTPAQLKNIMPHFEGIDFRQDPVSSQHEPAFTDEELLLKLQRNISPTDKSSSRNTGAIDSTMTLKSDAFDSVIPPSPRQLNESPLLQRVSALLDMF